VSNRHRMHVASVLNIWLGAVTSTAPEGTSTRTTEAKYGAALRAAEDVRETLRYDRGRSRSEMQIQSLCSIKGGTLDPARPDMCHLGCGTPRPQLRSV
jgi:hypothetical protein